MSDGNPVHRAVGLGVGFCVQAEVIDVGQIEALLQDSYILVACKGQLPAAYKFARPDAAPVLHHKAAKLAAVFYFLEGDSSVFGCLAARNEQCGKQQ